MDPQRSNNNVIVNLSFEFAFKIIRFCDKLSENKKHVIANQLLRSALSIGANIREAQNSESFADFIHKMKISCKESDETEFYLQLIDKAYSFSETTDLLKDIANIGRILTKIVSTSKNKKFYNQTST